MNALKPKENLIKLMRNNLRKLFKSFNLSGKPHGLHLGWI